MESVTFDTLTAAKTLERAGFDDTQAEAMVKTINKAVNESVATKADLKVSDESVHGKIKVLDESVKGKFKALDESVQGKINVLDESVKGEFKAVRGEIKALDESVKGEFKAVRAEFKALDDSIEGKLKALELSMTIKLGAMLFATALFILGVGLGVGKFLFS